MPYDELRQRRENPELFINPDHVGCATCEPPWNRTGVALNPLLPDARIVWMHVGTIRVIHGRPTRASKPIDPQSPYVPLIVNSDGIIQDGHHRYFDLIDSGYGGLVPCVVADI